jgi:hypothetical protein
VAGVALAFGASAAGAPTAEPIRTVFKEIQTPCKGAGKTQVGMACLDKTGAIYPDKWNVGIGNATWSSLDGFTGTFTYAVPKMVAGTSTKLPLTAKIEDTRKQGRDVRFCITMTFTRPTQETGDPCATATAPPGGSSGSGSNTLTLLPIRAADGATANLSVGFQDGPHLLFTYVAETPPKTVVFALKHGGLPKTLVGHPYLDMTTVGIGSGTYNPEGNTRGGYFPLLTVKGRVVRTVEYVDVDSPEKVKREGTTVFKIVREQGSAEARYLPGVKILDLPLEVVSTNDRTCEHITGAMLYLVEGTQGDTDRFWLNIRGCTWHGGNFLHDRSAEGKKPIVHVAISEK